MPLTEMLLEHRDVPGASAPDGNPTTLHVVFAGPPAGTPVLLLHGFPECWYGWRHQIEALAKSGFRVIAPDLRGYHRSSRPKALAAYRIDALVEDVRVLLTNLGITTCHLVGHDWGAAIAWEVAATYPDVIRTLTIANSPRAHVLLAVVRRSLRQLRRSWYILMFQAPLLGEGFLMAVGAKRLFQGSSAPGTFTEADIAVYEEAWARPGALTAMLNYYRANRVVRPRSALTRIRPPTLVLWGMNDAALGTELIGPTLAECDDGRVVELPGVSHWSPAEGAPTFNAALLGHLAAHGGTDPLVYKLVPANMWAAAPKPWVGSADDVRDGFVHLSARGQVTGTLAAHFVGAGDLMALGLDPGRLPAGALRWEESRGGKRFPHLYAPVTEHAVVTTHSIIEGQSGHVMPETW